MIASDTGDAGVGKRGGWKWEGEKVSEQVTLARLDTFFFSLLQVTL